MGLVSFDLKLPDFGLLILSQIDEKEDLLDGFGVVLILQLDYIYKQFREESITRMNARTSLALREESITRTVYVSDIDQQVYKIKTFLVAIFHSLPIVCVRLLC